MSDDESFDLLSSLDNGDLSPSLRDWASGTADSYDVVDLDLDLDSLSLSSVHSSDLLEAAITATRNGESAILSTVSQFAGILSQTGIHGPRLLKALNLATRATKIGAGSQFTVFKEKSHEGYTGNEGLVIKRVNVPLSRKAAQRFADTPDYRLQLRTLGLELLALCNPSLRRHPNIVRLIAWGYDYPFADMPVPVLFVEAALMPLTDFLAVGNDCSSEVKYQLSLDVANGIEALHHLHIVHGDLKPDNVLVFGMESEKVPFRAKLSDFGVCIDLEAPDARLTMSDYRGTPAWLAPEVANDDLTRFCPFKPDLMFRFDAYSFGLTVLSMFVNRGEPVDLDEDPENASEEISEMLYEREDIPSALRAELRKAILKLLAEDPRNRPLPTSQLLKTDTPAYASWLSFAKIGSESAPYVGTLDPMYNKGPLFWYRLDPSVLAELEAQYMAAKQGASADTPGDVLLGMAQTVTGAKPSYLDRLLLYVTDAAKGGYSPARAVYAQVMAAHDRSPEFEAKVLEDWAFQAVAEGYLFAHQSALTNEKLEQAKSTFRRNGGLCADPFLGKQAVVDAARSPQKAVKWKLEHGLIVDQKANTMLHAAAALGELDTVRSLLDEADIAVDVENDSGETPLYKACQAGHASIIQYLLQRKADASRTTRPTGLSPLHWLFMLPDEVIHLTAQQLVAAGADVNAVVRPVVGENSGGFPERIQIVHYPFELPHGTPLHWAAAFRNLAAMNALIDLGANLDAKYHGCDSATTPLALAAWFGDVEVAQTLVTRGADGKLIDSMGRNTLHSMTKYFPERHGYLPHHWHAWIRHGNWEEYLDYTSKLIRLLLDAGAAVNAKDTGYPPLTPIAAAVDLGVWNGGIVSALLAAGADLHESILSAGDTVLHSWASIVGPRLDYPRSYIPTLRRIVTAMPDIDIRNKFESDTPLHSLSTTYHPEDEFEQACEILLEHDPPADLNAQTRRGATPLSIALETKDDPARRGLFLLHKGASPTLLTDQDKDILFAIANNSVLHDKETYELITAVLQYISSGRSATKSKMGDTGDIHETYQKLFLPNQGAIHSLIAAVIRGKVRTTTLLLSLGLRSRLNDLDPSKPRGFTVLDHALHSAELSRRAHMEKLATYKPGPAQRAATDEQVVYDDGQGPPSRAAEAYHAFPEVLRCLREEGAKRACELELSGTNADGGGDTAVDGTYIQQQRWWDWTSIYTYGYTPVTQPHRERWELLYELARYPVGWREEQIEELTERYADGIWRPDTRFLEEEEDRELVSAVVVRIGAVVGGGNDEGSVVRLEAVDPVKGKVEVTVRVADGKVVDKTKVK
ncbi:ankyrin repeat protein [Aspergillus indologenus CBS 114.80]|uniref:Ankyrin repeat protein n=1 Tax=Aspergillus indologenus CBS 114.80 TaxID=1450541 RepID=A0A2V5IHF4_9EURO|nr:ankyrin repeat protein [Aspergillus indologenus CBS 114.80]